MNATHTLSQEQFNRLVESAKYELACRRPAKAAELVELLEGLGINLDGLWGPGGVGFKELTPTSDCHGG